VGCRAESVEAATVIRFDITLGDALFVDRLSCKRPQAGDPFVFRTNAMREELGKLTGVIIPTNTSSVSAIGGEARSWIALYSSMVSRVK
jgi:hypothetical protein